MRGRIKSISSHDRRIFSEGWSVCAQPPGRIAGPEQLALIPLSEWFVAAFAGSVADVMRSLGSWSLDGPARRFDADDWWYRISFDAPDGNAGDAFVLGFDGLATIAEVWLNGELVLSSNNMFVEHELDATDRLRLRGNELLICHRSLDQDLLKRRPRPRWRSPMVEHQQLRWFRTTLLGRTPGWSPPAAVVGPWRDIWLERRRSISVEDVEVRSSVTGHTGQLRVSCKIHAHGNAVEEVEISVRRGDHYFSSALIARADGESFEGILVIEQVDLWWPHTHGEPAVYDAVLIAQLSGSDSVEVKLGLVGFRTIDVETANDQFAISVNGVPIFCRGACWTPTDVVRLRASPKSHDVTLKTVCRAGMNMLRVAGTMVYEDDAFLESCDRHGILLWQDMMFANMDYPHSDADFLRSVSVEIRQQLRRLQGHACLAVICGNSEVEQQAAMWGAPRDAWAPSFFHLDLKRWVAELCAGVTFWPSSAHGGAIPHQIDSGTTSYFGVGAYLRPLEDARRSGLRFATESLAFANVPEDVTISRMPGGSAIRVHHPTWKERSPRDLGAGWDFDDVRDYYFGKLFGIDPLSVRYVNHERYLKMSRMLTGEIMAAALLDWRRNASPCRGALVLFLQDLWAGAGWGLLDDQGLPKACYHYVKRACQPLTVALSDEGNNGLNIHLWNDLRDRQIVQLDTALYRLDGTCVTKASRRVELECHSASTIAAGGEFDSAIDIAGSFRFSESEHACVVASLCDRDGNDVAQAFHLQEGLRVASQLDLGMTAIAHRSTDGTVVLDLTSRSFAQAVHFEVSGFLPDDEYFHMAPQSVRRVKLSPLKGAGPSRPTGQTFAMNCKQSVNIQWTA